MTAGWTRNFRIVALVLAGVAWSGGADAKDSTIPCNGPPDKGSFVAVRSGSQVTTTQNKPAGTCTFSINGAVATSPPAHQVIEAVNTFREPRPFYLLDSGLAARSVAALAAAAAPVNEVPKELVDLFLRDSRPLRDCLNGFAEKGGNDPNAYDGKGFTCRSIPPYANEDAKRDLLRKGVPAVGVPTLVIVVDWQGGALRSTVYLPVTMRGQPPLR